MTKSLIQQGLDALEDWSNSNRENLRPSESHTSLKPEGIEMLKNDAALGRAVRRLVDGGAFDLTDSPKSFVSTVRRLARESNAPDAAVARPGIPKIQHGGCTSIQ